MKFYKKTLMAMILLFMVQVGCLRIHGRMLNSAVQIEHDTLSFSSFRKHFAPWSRDEIKEDFLFGSKHLDYSIATRIMAPYRFFIPLEKDCGCEDGELYYFPAFYLEQKNYIIMTMNCVCDVPNVGFPYDDTMLVTYRPDGTIIDSRVIARSGDVWFYFCGGTVSPFNLKVLQGTIILGSSRFPSAIPNKCEVVEKKYTCTEDGFFKEETVREWNDSVYYNAKTYKYTLQSDSIKKK